MKPPKVPDEAKLLSGVFFYPLAALIVGAVLFMPVGGAQTPGLRPDQQQMLDMVMAGVEPSMRPMVRDQMVANIAPYSEAQVALMLKAMAETGTSDDGAGTTPQPAQAEISPEDLAYNRAQYEPAIRKAHAAQKAYDEFVNASFKSHCPPPRHYARWGAGWRYELADIFLQKWETASWSADIDVQVMGASYPPQDGRYDFDFSKVRTTFDKTAVDDAIKSACAAFRVKGEAFLAKLDPVVVAERWNDAFRLQQTALDDLEPLRGKLREALDRHSPASDFALIDALSNPKPARR